MTTQTDVTAIQLAPATWTVDPAHSHVGFVVRHLMSKVRGTFHDVSGTITTRSDDPTDATVDVKIGTASIDTGDATRDGHLQSNDFFHTAEIPHIGFVSTGITGDADGYAIAGDLTIRGTTRPVTLQADFLGVAVDAFGKTRLGAEATTTINRKDFGVDFNIPLDGGKFLIGDKIEIQLEIEAVQA